MCEDIGNEGEGWLRSCRPDDRMTSEDPDAVPRRTGLSGVKGVRVRAQPASRIATDAPRFFTFGNDGVGAPFSMINLSQCCYHSGDDIFSRAVSF